MESLADEMKREDLRDKFWNQVKGWGDKRIANFVMTNLPMGMAEDLVDEIEEMPEEEKTPREAFTEGRARADLRVRLEKVTGEELLDMDKERLIKEMALEMQVPALEEFVSHLENSGEEVCKTWRPKLVSIIAAKHPEDDKPVVFGYFKTDITEEELESCHRAFLRQNNWDYEVNIPEGYHWKLRRDLEEMPDALSTNAGWVRYIIGDLT